MDLPDHWRFESNEADTLANLRWWEQFNDDVLDDLIEEAIDYNRDIKVAIARVYEFEGKLLVTASQLYPQISLNPSYFRQETSKALIPPTPGFPRTYNAWSVLGTLTYEIDVWGQIRSATEAAEAELLGSIEARRTVLLTVVSNVASAYFTLRQYDAQLEIAKDTLKSRQESLRLVILRYEGGLTSEIDVRMAQSEVDDALATVKQIELNIGLQEDLLSVLVGRVPACVERGLSLTEFAVPFCVPAGLPSDIIENRPDIVEAEDDLLAATANIGVAVAEYFPSFNLTGYYGYQSRELRNLFTNAGTTWQYGLNIIQPIFTGWRIEGDVEIARAQMWEALYIYEQVVLTALQEVDDALISIQKTRELVEVETDRVRVLKDYLRLAQLRYDNGETDYLTVLDAERTLFRAQLDLAQEIGNSFISLVDLYRATAGGWVLDAELHDEWEKECSP
jgi:multidrug efflux system outer membrane protein